ncbi:g291 [Coccomyxa elongata]
MRCAAVVVLCIVTFDSIAHQAVEAKFRGAKPKKIPSLSVDGGVVDPNAGGGDGQKNPTVSGRVARRTKGGLLPWWVRKRLQEQTGTKEGVVDTKLFKAGRERGKTRLKNVQIMRLAEDGRNEAGAGDSLGVAERGDSAIVVKDLPLEGESGDQGADDRLAAYDTQMGMLAEKAKLEELSRGSGAEPDLLMDEAVKQAVLEHESAAQKGGGGQQVAVGGADASAEAAGGAADDEYDDADYLAGQPQGSLEGEEGDEDSARRALLQSKKRMRAKKARSAEDIPGMVSRSLPAEVLPAEQEEAKAARLQLDIEPQSRGDQGGGGMGDEDDRSIVMTDVSRAERQAEEQNAVSDPGDNDNFEEGLLSATDEEMGGRAVVRSQESMTLEQLGEAESGAGDVGSKRAGRGKRKGRRKGRREGPRRAKARQSRKRTKPERAGWKALLLDLEHSCIVTAEDA